MSDEHFVQKQWMGKKMQKHRSSLRPKELDRLSQVLISSYYPRNGNLFFVGIDYSVFSSQGYQFVYLRKLLIFGLFFLS
jgi:hypothetical protein